MCHTISASEPSTTQTSTTSTSATSTTETATSTTATATSTTETATSTTETATSTTEPATSTTATATSTTEPATSTTAAATSTTATATSTTATATSTTATDTSTTETATSTTATSTTASSTSETTEAASTSTVTYTSTVTEVVTTTVSPPPATTTPYIPARIFPPVVENRFRINYWATCNHYWQFGADLSLTDRGSWDTFVRSQVNLRRSYFQQACNDSQLETPSVSPNAACCVSCRDEDLLVNVPGYSADASNITNPLNGVLSDTVVLETGLDTGDSKAARFDGTPDTCVLLGSLANDAPYGRLCLQQPEKCDYGLSASVWVNYTVNSYLKEVLLATSTGYNQGFQFYTDKGKLTVLVIGAKGRWQASVDNFEMAVGKWRLLGFTWERVTGIIRIYIDSSVQTFYYLSTYSEPNAQGNPATEIRMGCEIGTDGSSTSHLKAVAIHPAMWLWPIGEDNLIILTGSIVYKLIKYQTLVTTAVPTTPSNPAFAYSTILRELSYSPSDSNPFYEVANFYLRAGVQLGNLGPESLSSNVTMKGWLRGDQAVTNFYIKSSPAQLTIGSLGSACIANHSLCTDGISGSLWITVTQSLPVGDSEFLRFNVFSLLLRNTSSGISVQVKAGNRALDCQIVFQQWSNLGFIYNVRGSVPRLVLYINGLLCGSTDSASVGNVGNYGGNITLGSSNGGVAPVGLVLNHLAIWYRSLEDFEVHRFLGYTRDQLRLIRDSSFYWTTDPVVLGDSPILKDSTSYNLKSIYRTDMSNVIGTAILSETDRHNKSLVARLNSNWLGQFFLGNDIRQRPTETSIMWTDKCITDPCQRNCQINGLTMHMWIKIHNVYATKRQFFFSSGDFAEARSLIMDTRGISLFTTGALLGASLSTDRSDWAIVIDGNRFGMNEWFNLGFTWHPQEGMRLFLNGTDYGIQNQHPDISYKSFDKSRRAVVGRFDDDQNITWKGNSEWTMGNFSLSDLAFYEIWMSPADFARSVGSINNRFYAESDLLVWGQEIIDTEFPLLKQARLLSVPIGPNGNVSKEGADFAKIGSNGHVGIKAFRADECPRKLSACANQIFITVWIKLLSKSSETLLTVLSLGTETDIFEGFGLNISIDGSLVAWVKRAGLTNKMITKSTVKIRFRRWTNLALHLSKTDLYPTIYLNGTNVSASLEYRADIYGGAAYEGSTTAGTLTVGKVTTGSTNDSFLLYLVAGWYATALASNQMHSALGLQSSQYNLMRLADEYWTVGGLWSQLQPYALQGVNTDLARDRYDTENGALCTRGTRGSYIVIGDMQGSCLSNTAPCKGYILTLMVKPAMPTNPGRVYLLSTGGHSPGYQGTAISLTSDGFLHVTVRGANRTCETSSPFNYSDWVQLQIRWYSEATIVVQANEVTISSRGGDSAACWQEVNSNETYEVGQLGRISNDGSNASAACFSDIMLMYNLLGSSGTLDYNTGSAMCYEQQVIHLPMHTVGNYDYENKANRSRRFSSPESVNFGSDVCLFAGAGCLNGITVSFWLRVETLNTLDYVDVLNTGYPSSQGLRVRIRKTNGASSFVGGYLISAEANIAGKTHRIETGAYPEQQLLVENWMNVGVSLTHVSIELYLNGILLRTSTRSTAESLPLSGSSFATIGSSFSTILMSDLVVWNESPLNCLSPKKNKKLLTGMCATISDNLQTTCLPVGADSCQSVIENSMCLDERFDNVVAIDSSGRMFSTLPEAVTASRVIAGTAANGIRADFLQSALNILDRIATNVAVPSSTTNTTIRDTVSAISQAVSNIMNTRFSSRFRSLVDSGQINPNRVFASVEALALRLAAKLPSACSPVMVTEGHLHWSTQLIGTGCSSGPVEVLLYTNLTRRLWSRALDAVYLPSGLFADRVRIANVKVACVVYDQVSDLLANDATNETVASNLTNGSIVLTVNSRIVSLQTSMPAALTHKLVEPLNLTLQLINSNKRSKADPAIMQLETRCVFWDPSKASVSSFGRGMWSTEGCIKLWEDESSVACSCYHTTSFAVLMQPAPVSNDNLHARIISNITYVLTCLSLVCLLVFIAVIARSKRLHGELYILHLNLAGALFVAQLAYALTDAARDNAIFCKAIAIVMHLFYVAAFALLLAESIWLFHAVVKGVIRGRMKWLLPVAWLLPITIVAAAAGLSGGAHGSQPHCWLGGIYIWSYLGPLLAFGCLAVAGCLVVVCNLSEQAIKRRDIQAELSLQARHCALLAPIVTISWLFAVPLVLWYSIPLHYFFVIFCATQGFWVFVCLGLLNPEFRQEAACCRAKHSRTRLIETTASVTGIQDIADSRASFDPSGDRRADTPIYHAGGPSAESTGRQQRQLASESQQQQQQDSKGDSSFGSQAQLRESTSIRSSSDRGGAEKTKASGRGSGAAE